MYIFSSECTCDCHNRPEPDYDCDCEEWHRDPVVKWMTWFRLTKNPASIAGHYPAHPGLKSLEEALVNHVNGVKP